MVIIRLFFAFFFIHGVCFADTLLIGFDASDSTVYNDACWDSESTSLHGDNFKANHFIAKASGTIAYFATRVSKDASCESDDVCWAIHDSDGNENVGALKAYGCERTYDWTVIGAGLHKWDVDTAPGGLTITQGTSYYLVFYSNAVQSDNYTDAGCTESLDNWRGTPNQLPADDCEDAGFTASEENESCASGLETSWNPTVPDQDQYDPCIDAASWFLYGVWATEEEETQVSISNASLQNGSIY